MSDESLSEHNRGPYCSLKSGHAGSCNWNDGRCDCRVGTVPVFDDGVEPTGRRACIACGHVSNPLAEKTRPTVVDMDDQEQLDSMNADALRQLGEGYELAREKAQAQADIWAEQLCADVKRERDEARAELARLRALLGPRGMALLAEVRSVETALREHGYDDSAPAQTVATIIEELQALRADPPDCTESRGLPTSVGTEGARRGPGRDGAHPGDGVHHEQSRNPGWLEDE